MNKKEDRLIWIDFMADTYGSVGRIDLVNRFDLSDPAASLDLQSYRNIAPNNLKYDFRSKRHVKTDVFKPVYHIFGIGLAEYLKTMINNDEKSCYAVVEPHGEFIAVVIKKAPSNTIKKLS